MARILVVDDEPDVILLCRVNLQHAGYDVLEASDGEQGLALALSELPDAIVLDLMLPLMDGYGVLDRLRADERTRTIPGPGAHGEGAAGGPRSLLGTGSHRVHDEAVLARRAVRHR